MFIIHIWIAIICVYSEDVARPNCVQTQACRKNFDWDAAKCKCACLRLAKCAAGNFWNKRTCSCQPLPCASVYCPVNYSPDQKDKCKCKCNAEAPASPDFPRLGSRWDQTVCNWVNSCDFIEFCKEPNDDWSFGSCSCKPSCKNVTCRKTFAADIDQNCDCLCTLPKQVCKIGFEWSKKTCSCIKKS